MYIIIFLKGALIGLAAAAPLGPVGVLCTKRMLNNRLSGMVSGLGAATGDGLFAAIIAFGLTFVSNFIDGKKLLLHIFGGIILLIIGSFIFFEKARPLEITIKKSDLFSDYASAFLLTISNPIVLFSFTALFAALKLFNLQGYYLAAFTVVAGVVSGVIIWYLALAWGLAFVPVHLRTNSVPLLNKIFGAIIIVLGGLSLMSVF